MPRLVVALAAAALSVVTGVAAWAPRFAYAADADAGLLASPWQPLHAGSRIRLVGVASDAAGGVNGGIEIELAEGWKTYWRMPGEAGVPPQFEWQNSTNAAEVRVLYPAPTRLPEPGAESIGYKKHVLLPFAAKAATKGKPVGLKLEAEFGVCKDICVPAQATLALDLPVATGSRPLPALLQEAQARVPGPPSGAVKGRPTAVTLAAHLEGAKPQLSIVARFPGGAEAADLFIEAPDSIFVPMTKRSDVKPDGTATFVSSLSAATAKELKGKTLTVTLVGPAGAAEMPWKIP